ncbi:MAG: RNA-binding S4 domain-containing protein [bacterium]
MRLDLFLKLTRVIKRRSMAKKYCDHSLVKVNSQSAKAAREIRVGDEITLTFWDRIMTIRVLGIPSKGIRTQEANTLYTVISEERKASPDEIR